jgi:hypothetical protein
MGVESKDNGSGFKITNSGFISHSAPLEHVGDFELVFLLTCRPAILRGKLPLEREQIFPFGIYLELLCLLGKCPK